ncbi:hypothetical protein KIW84_065443 [Lathyrus oleraceus]|uniref:Transposase n=1 Tax=Pisum sativum TaxID=3888 RepID=A0A9D4WGS4_PEA|nr:hypothetical protein KIW84_065443 [Pisum sativum]
MEISPNLLLNSHNITQTLQNTTSPYHLYFLFLQLPKTLFSAFEGPSAVTQTIDRRTRLSPPNLHRFRHRTPHLNNLNRADIPKIYNNKLQSLVTALKVNVRVLFNLITHDCHVIMEHFLPIVRNEIPITCDDWRNKELNESKEKIWSEIKRCFNIEEERRGFCMKLAGKLLRGFQTFLSSKFLKDADGNFVDAELPKKYESLISAEEWEAFKSKRQDPVFQRISATNRERASSPAYPYRKGRVGYGRLEQSMLQKEESSETSLPAHVLWKEARVGKSGVPQEEVLHVYQKCEELSQSLSPDDTKGILSRALDVPEYSGRVRGKGFGVTPTSLSIKKGKAPSNRELHARLEAMQAELDALRREREASASTVYRDASDKNSINCTFQPNIPEGISHCQLYLSI